MIERMPAEPLKDVERIFERAASLPPEERRAYLDEACAGNASLRDEVESLLAADDEAGEFLEEPALPGLELPRPELPPAIERAGPYRILRRIGEGGMSEVFLAVRDEDEYKKSVALKLIRSDLDREDMLRRFRTERQILAGLDHPNIAKLLDGGTTDEGLPYFVMDYIEGVPLDEHCDAQRLSVNQRIDLFREVCSAVQYSHQNLIVHRDLKAGNILVTADGVPKLLDFGIAKLLKPDQFAQDVERTQVWMRPMTPRYASPEQVQGKTVTTASDVYSLGVLLYKLLTGHLPYRLEGRPPTELGKLVVEQAPERPSTSITRIEPETSPDASATPEAVSAARATQPQQLRRQLAGDLDNIVLMAIRKEPTRRYASVEQLSEDLLRYQKGLPVVARKDTLGYRTSKFLRRNWAAVAVAAAFVVLLIGFAASLVVKNATIARERDQARLERDRAEQVVGFMEKIFEVPDPLEGGGQNITAREILDRGAARVTDELRDRPEVQATLMAAIGNVYKNLGLFDQAKPLLQEALETRREVLGSDHLDVAENLQHFGILLREKGELDEAEALLSESLDIRRRQLGEEAPEVVESLNHLGMTYRGKGELERAEGLYREALAVEDVVGDHREMMRRRVLGSKHPHVAQAMSNLGATLGMQGRYDDALPYLQGALDLYREILDPDHPALIEGLNNLAKLRQRMGDPEAAEPLYREALAIERARLGDGNPKVAHISANLAELMRSRGDTDEAEALLRDGLTIRTEALGESHADTGGSWVALGSLLTEAGSPTEAEPMLRKGLDILTGALGTEHWRVAEATSLLGECLTALGRYDQAEPLLLRGLDGLTATRGESHMKTREARERLDANLAASRAPRS
jgi:serine/threonine-protein kinase